MKSIFIIVLFINCLVNSEISTAYSVYPLGIFTLANNYIQCDIVGGVHKPYADCEGPFITLTEENLLERMKYASKGQTPPSCPPPVVASDSGWSSSPIKVPEELNEFMVYLQPYSNDEQETVVRLVHIKSYKIDEVTNQCTTSKGIYFSATRSTKKSCSLPSGDDCSFYSNCLEYYFPCESSLYPYAISYGKKFCQLLSENDKFSEEGKRWVIAVRKCLQKSLANSFPDHNPTCEIIREIAYNSHPKCYANPGDGLSICSLSWRDYSELFSTIGATLFSPDTLNEATETASACRNNYIQKSRMNVIDSIGETIEDTKSEIQSFLKKNLHEFTNEIFAIPIPKFQKRQANSTDFYIVILGTEADIIMDIIIEDFYNQTLVLPGVSEIINCYGPCESTTDSNAIATESLLLTSNVDSLILPLSWILVMMISIIVVVL